jgi:hypothetical protein
MDMDAFRLNCLNFWSRTALHMLSGNENSHFAFLDAFKALRLVGSDVALPITIDP